MLDIKIFKRIVPEAFLKSKITNLKEQNVIMAYVLTDKKFSKSKNVQNKITVATVIKIKELDERTLKKKRGHLKHKIRLRYGWQYRPELEQFRKFRKFFSRTFRRFKKIQKNRMFITHFKRNFSKLTGFNEKFFYKKWLLFKRKYNQYWSADNSVRKFSQLLLTSPYVLLVSLNIAPSFFASKHLINCGAISINGKTSSIFNNFVPGDIMQIDNKTIYSGAKLLSYQKWQFLNTINKKFTFLQIDWSAMLFLMINWPGAYEINAPKFLTERWIHYYIRYFSLRPRKYKTVKFNKKLYKKFYKKNIPADIK